jgi:hypothetical protein
MHPRGNGGTHAALIVSNNVRITEKVACVYIEGLLSSIYQTLRKPVVLRSSSSVRPSAKFTCPYLGISRGDSPVVLMFASYSPINVAPKGSDPSSVTKTSLGTWR